MKNFRKLISILLVVLTVSALPLLSAAALGDNAPEPVSVRLSENVISVGELASAQWNASSGAQFYKASLLDKKGEEAQSTGNIKGCRADFKIDKAGVYSVRVIAVNAYGESAPAYSDRLTVKNELTVKFTDDDGTVLNVQTVPYGGSAVSPASPRKTGYAFAGWSREYEKLTDSAVVRATYTKKTYTVKFLDFEGNLLTAQKVKYGNAASAPDAEAPTGYTFAGWDKDFSKVTENITVRMVAIKDESELPISVESCEAVRADEKSGYNLSIVLSNVSDVKVGGRVVAALKTEGGKFLAMTESSAFTIPQKTNRSMEVFVPYEGAATYAEVYVVKTYSTLLPLSESYRAEINTDADWTPWVTDDDKPEDGTYFEASDYRTEYRYKERSTSDETYYPKDGWNLKEIKYFYGNWGAWSEETTTTQYSSSTKDVKYRDQTDIVSYYMVSYETKQDKLIGSNEYRKTSINGNYSDYDLKESFGENFYSQTVSVEDFSNLTTVAAGESKFLTGVNKSSETGYVIDSKIYFVSLINRVTTRFYSYRTRSYSTRYYYEQWSDWSDWSTTPVTASEDCQVETRQTRRYLVNDPTLDESGETKTLTGTLDSSFAGKHATLFIYKISDASDYTNEYVGQTVIDEDGRYVFTFKLREEPSVRTGDFTVTLGVEGANSLIYLNPLNAPKPTYTVNIRDWDGALISTQQVERGESASLPETSPTREGYRFAGWDYSNSSIYENTTINAVYVRREYTVAYIDWVNEYYEVRTYGYGDPLIAPELPSSESSDALGWDKVLEGVTEVKSNMVLTAQYETKTYTVSFYGYDDNLIETKTVSYGESVDAPELPAEENVIFDGWDKANELKSVKKTMSLHPLFRYTSDTAAPTASAESGTFAEPFTLELSSETDGARIYYSINGGAKQLYSAPIEIDETAVVEYYAVKGNCNQSSVKKTCYIIGDGFLPVTVYDENDEIVDLTFAEAGGALPEKLYEFETEGYVLDGYYTDSSFTEPWDNEVSVTAPVSLYRKLSPIEYTVTFTDENGGKLSEQKVIYKHAAAAPDYTPSEDYVFIGWNCDFDSVTCDMTVSAVVKPLSEIASVKLNKSSLRIQNGLSYTLKATVTPVGSEVQWSSSDESVLTVTNGKLTAKKAGTAVVTATVAEGVFAECTVTVTRNKYEEICTLETSDIKIRNGVLTGLSSENNTASELLEALDGDNLAVLDAEGYPLNGKVGTGCEVVMTDDAGDRLDSVVVIVAGDISGDGLVNNKDLARLLRANVGKEALSDTEALAADLNGDGEVNNRDASMLSRILLGR